MRRFCTWERIRSAIEEAIANPPKSPHVPPNQMSRGATSPLVKKLNIKTKTVVVILNGPNHFSDALTGLPSGVTLRKTNRGRRDLTIWFVDRAVDFLDRLNEVSNKIEDGSLWVAYPKKTSRHKTDLTKKMIRTTCLEIGLVDYKVCSIDDTWTGIRFTWRRD